ncbi:hypothetical protein [Endozoicomonas sp. 4G]|uniref:hypothetical protein n=1 Tax=Endozoicomonas sp. 4G TaxID=2872754 RepID=UPI002078E739|nr:hypothetical protein [Endozoicomonas sp. 4G]
MTIKHVLVLFFVIISNICHADMEQDLEEIKKSMELANEKIEKTKIRLSMTQLRVSDPLAASAGFGFMFYPTSQMHPEAGGELNEAIAYITKALRHINFFAESYPGCKQAVTLLNLHTSVHDQLEHVSLESDVLLAIPSTSEIKGQLVKVEDIAKKINFELSRI